MPDLQTVNLPVTPESYKPPETPTVVPERPTTMPETPVVPAEDRPVSVTPSPPPTVVVKDPLEQQVENVLAVGLEGLYTQLPMEKQREFKERGEETAIKIAAMLMSAQVKIQDIIKLIVSWLKLIPGINKFFVESQAKTKAQQLVEQKDNQVKV